MPEVALVTCSRLPNLDPDDLLLLAPLETRGVRVTAAIWDDPDIDWDRFDLCVVRSTWDYTERRDRFVEWALSVPRLINPADVIEWNTDKHYLVDLAAAGVPTVATTWISSVGEIALPTDGLYVLKPAIGAGSMDAGLFDLRDAADHERARRHAERLVAAGQTVMVQPYLSAIEDSGETGVIFIDGTFSHATRKGTMLGPESLEDVDELYKKETIDARSPTAAELDVATRTLNYVPGGPGRLAYARVDMIPGPNGEPQLIELELTEPSLFMATAPGSEERFAAAIAARARR